METLMGISNIISFNLKDLQLRIYAGLENEFIEGVVDRRNSYGTMKQIVCREMPCAYAMTFRKKEKESGFPWRRTAAQIFSHRFLNFSSVHRQEKLACFPPSCEMTLEHSFSDAMKLLFHRRLRSSTGFVPSGLTTSFLVSWYFVRACVLFRLSWVFPAHVPEIKVVIFASSGAF